MSSVSPEPGYTHRYAPTTPLPPYSSSPQAWGMGYPPGGPTSPPPPQRRGPGWIGLVIAAALVGGALAGVATAAGYDSLANPETTSAPPANALEQPVLSVNGRAPSKGSVTGVAQRVLPSVVQINVKGPQLADSGSGIILSADGQILTNNHVIEAAADKGVIEVSFNDGTTAPARIVGRDPLTDIAVIQAQGVSGMTPAALGRSADLKVGQQVVAIGSPFGLESTVTSGIVSALNRPVTAGPAASSGQSPVYPAIQTDAPINPGNSGGPLVNMAGQVVGINSAIKTAATALGAPGGSIGLGFAIPIDLARSIASQLRSGETPTHARLGVQVDDAVDAAGLTTVGAHVVRVEPGSAADRAGLEKDDVITQVDDQPVSTADALVAAIRSYRPGEVVTLTYRREGRLHRVDVTLDSDRGTPAS